MSSSISGRRAAGMLALFSLVAGCGGGASIDSSSTKTAGTSNATTAVQSAATTSGSQPAASPAVIPGLRVTVPAGWTVNEDNPVNFIVQAPGGPHELASIWLNMRAVKSTGAGHGTTVLTNIGTTPSALVRWFSTNPDFRVLASPRRASIGRVPMTTLVLGVSTTARYGDSGCPANPHCADLFTNPTYQHDDWFGISGNEVVRLFLGRTSQGTAIVGLDANNPAALQHLETVAKPFLSSVRFPS
jgi:hypothetical protein